MTKDLISKLSIEDFTIDALSHPLVQDRKVWRITWDVMGMKFQSENFDTEKDAIEKYRELVSELNSKYLTFDVQLCYVGMIKLNMG